MVRFGSDRIDSTVDHDFWKAVHEHRRRFIWIYSKRCQERDHRQICRAFLFFEKLKFRFSRPKTLNFSWFSAEKIEFYLRFLRVPSNPIYHHSCTHIPETYKSRRPSFFNYNFPHEIVIFYYEAPYLRQFLLKFKNSLKDIFISETWISTDLKYFTDSFKMWTFLKVHLNCITA